MASLRKQVRELELAKSRRQAADIDPEDDVFSKQQASDEGSGSDLSEDENLGREHYETVGKSKMRKSEKPKLDQKKYGGEAVSRSSIFQNDGEDDDALAPVEDEDEDPFAAKDEEQSLSDDNISGDNDDLLDGEDVDGELASDDEIDSDEAFEKGEEDNFRGKGFVFRGSGKDLKSLPVGSSDNEESDQKGSDDGSEVSDEDQSDVDMEDFDDDDEDNDEGDEDLEDASSDDDDDDEEEQSKARPRPSTINTSNFTDREKLKALISNDTAALASSLSASLSSDAKKGTAVKKQNQTLDRLLDARIKLQKGLTASDDLHLSTSATPEDEDTKSAFQKAEEAALKLYSTIESLRHSILEASTTNNETEAPSKKRKRPQPATPQTSNSDLWSRIKTTETQTLPTRRQTLDKWSNKTRGAAPLSTQSKLTTSDTQTSQTKLTAVLDAYLSSETPKILEQTASPAPRINYEDATFYQSLLRDLINSRASSTNLQSTGGGGFSLPVVPMKLHASGNTAKARKIDTKASKGRKIRYTVHEKLEHFMAGEGRGNSVGQWNDGAVREFFASLLGQRGMLGEEEDHEEDGMDMDDREVEALRLFRT